ncbi:glycosyltransferase family 4 protein [Formosa sp. S-31]|uniref:glycosyltransferase family 4 protein n=1 Tax=Formosa sp. S-31 TaxID=2790949 RepID=UPI003EBF76FE
MSLKLHFLFRKKLPQYNSIEELYDTVIQQLSKMNTVTVVEVPHAGAGLSSLLKNLKAFKPVKNTITHITGDVHYMALVTGSKTVLTIHDVKSIIKGPWLKQQLIKMLWFWLPALCVNKITVISKFSKEELSKVIPFSKQKIEVVYNPVNYSLRYVSKSFNAERPKILLIGTKPNKNLERTLKALEYIPCSVTIIGKLSHEQMALLERYNIEFENRFHIPYEDIVQAYVDCDLLVFASTYEGFGMPIIEAQAVGRPVITSNIGAMKEVAGDSALLVDPYNEAEISQAVQSLISDLYAVQTLVEKGLENVKRFQLDKIVNDYKAVYKTVMHG